MLRPLFNFAAILKGDFDGHPFRGNQWSGRKMGPTEAFSAKINERKYTTQHLRRMSFGNDDALMQEFDDAIKNVEAKTAAGLETYRSHVENLADLDSGKTKRARYTKERLKEHRRIIKAALANSDQYKAKPGKQPEVIFLAGRGGSGKGNFNKKKGLASAVYSDKTHLVLDPDAVKEAMTDYVPGEAYLSHKESSHIFDKLVVEARRRKLNVVLDTTMRSSASGVVNAFDRAGYTMQAHFMHLPPEGAAVRAMDRWQNKSEYAKTGERGRLVPPDVVLGMVNNEKNFDAILPKMKSWSVWSNDRPLSLGPSKIIDKKKYDKAHGVKKFEGVSFVLVEKANPYHDQNGRFTSRPNASFVSLWGKQYENIEAKANRGKNAVASKVQHAKVKELAHILGTHVRSGGSLEDKFGKSALSQAQLHAEGVKAYGTHAIPNVSDGYRNALGNSVAEAFAASNLSVKEKVKAKIPLTKQEQEAMDKAKAYDKAHYSKKMKATKLEDAKGHYAAYLLAAGALGPDSADAKKALSKYNKAATLAQKHGADVGEVADSQYKAEDLHKQVMDAVGKAVKVELLTAIKADHLAGSVSGTQKAFQKVVADHKGVLSEKQVHALHAETQLLFKQQHEEAKKSLADAYAAYQPFKQDKAKGVTWDTLAKQHGVSKEHIKQLYTDYQESYSDVSNTYGEYSATAAVQLGKQLYAAKKTTGKTPIHDVVQTTAPKVPEGVAAALGAKPKEAPVDTTPAKTSDAVGVASGIVKKPSNKAEAMDAAKALGKQYYLLKQAKYPGMAVANAPEEIKQAHALYEKAKEQYVAMGGNKDEFPSISSGLKNEAIKEIDAKKKAEEYTKNLHTQNLTNAAYELAKAKHANPHGGLAVTEAEDKLNEAKKLASEAMPEHEFGSAVTAGSMKHLNEVEAVKSQAKQDVASASASLHDAFLAHPKDASHKDVMEAASTLDKLLSKHSGVLSSEEIALAKKSGEDTAKANAAKAEEFKKLYGDPSKAAKNYDVLAKKSPFVEVTHSTSFISHGKKMIEKLSDTEKSAVVSYTGDSFRAVNRSVGAAGTAKMKGLPSVHLMGWEKNKMQEMDAAFSKTTLGKNVKLRRNMAQKYFWEQLGVSMDSLHKLTPEQLKSLVGRCYKETAFSSTSTNLGFSSCFAGEAAKTGSVSLYIRASADMPGLHAKSISHHSPEDEVVLPRGTTYVIRSITPTGVTHPSSNDAMFRIEVDMVGSFPDKL